MWMTQTEPVSLSSLQCLALLCMETEVSCVSSVQGGQTQESVSNETVLVKSAIYYSAIVSLAINLFCVTPQFKDTFLNVILDCFAPPVLTYLQ